MLGELIRSERAKSGWTQEKLAAEVDTTGKWISQIESGGKSPSLQMLVAIHGKTGSIAPLPVWLLAWVQSRLGGVESADMQIDEITKMIDSSISKLGYQNKSSPGINGLSLADFPLAFEPVTVVCGDRREPTPKTQGDIFAYSLSVSDLMFLPKLGISANTMIKSDKLFALMDEDYLRENFGRTNLLIIGSPAVNFAARIANEYSIFRFDVSPEVRAFHRRISDLTILNDIRNLQDFTKLVQEDGFRVSEMAASIGDNSQVERERINELADLATTILGGQRYKYWMNSLRKPGLVDPPSLRIEAQVTREDNDFGIVSIAQNPWSESSEYVAILVGGIHGPGTAHAVKALGINEMFEDHPYGGVIEVQLDPRKDWPSRFEKASLDWQTPPYTPEEIVSNLETELRQDANRRLPNMLDEELRSCIEFVRTLSARREVGLDD